MRDFRIASYPNFNLMIIKMRIKIFIIKYSNLMKLKEPGSTLKIITFSSALNEKIYLIWIKILIMINGYEYVSCARIKSWKRRAWWPTDF